MTRIMAEFFIRYYGVVQVQFNAKPGDSSDFIAQRLTALALISYNRQWLGAFRQDLKVVGVTNFIEVLNNNGTRGPWQEDYRVPVRGTLAAARKYQGPTFTRSRTS